MVWGILGVIDGTNEDRHQEDTWQGPCKPHGAADHCGWSGVDT